MELQKMKEIIENSFEDKELLASMHLQEFPRRSIAKENLVIGRNGSGKTRLLRFLAAVGKNNNWRVIGLDFAESRLLQGVTGKEIGRKLVWQREFSDEIFSDLYTAAKSQLNDLLDLIKKTMPIDSELLMPSFQEMLSGINDTLRPLLGKTVLLRDGNIYLSNPETHGEDPLESMLEYLSPGEVSLLTISLVALLVGQNPNEPALVLIDEPEIHLHPEAVLQVFDMMRALLKNANCCLFVATHSIFLLPMFDFHNVLYMKMGALEKMDGKLYQKIINDLLYGNGKRENLVEFFNSYEEWSYAQFMAECFENPTTVDTVSEKDPQYRKFRRIVRSLYKDAGKARLNILDYGAGEGRIGRCLNLDPNVETLKKKLIYNTYNVVAPKNPIPARTGIFGENFTKKEELDQCKEKMDVVLLYNVLHEISVTDWEEDLNQILKLLKRDGILIFSERKTLSVGENPFGDSGYLLLGADEMKRLFFGMDIEQIELEEDIRDVTVAFAIRNPDGKEIFEETILETLRILLENTRKMIQANIKTNHLKPRDYAFYCQQYFSAEHALQLFDKPH